PLNLETESETYTFAYSHPVIRSRSENLYVRGTLSAHDGRTDLFGVRDTEDHLRVLRLGLTYDRADSLAGVNIVDVELSHGLRGLGASRNGDPMLSRANGRVDFSKIVLYAARVQPLDQSWSVFGALTAQHAFNNLLSSELFSYGGEQFGRGHDPSELVGDHGAALKLELRYTGALPAAAGSYTAYAFYDHGHVRQRESGGLKAGESAASAGLGVRFGIGSHVSGVIEAAKPVIRVVAQEGDQKTRIFGGLSVRF
ncbi:MAG: ShlB/FhaC/HecB family hemolysin secretion/activation protein, partial [Burkholderiales bacterium]